MVWATRRYQPLLEGSLRRTPSGAGCGNRLQWCYAGTGVTIGQRVSRQTGRHSNSSPSNPRYQALRSHRDAEADRGSPRKRSLRSNECSRVRELRKLLTPCRLKYLGRLRDVETAGRADPRSRMPSCWRRSVRKPHRFRNNYEFSQPIQLRFGD